MLQCCDLNGDGALSFHEMADGFAIATDGHIDSSVIERLAFTIDQDSNGNIEWQEFENWFELGTVSDGAPAVVVDAVPAEESCNDNEKNCAAWATDDECEHNSVYMLAHCRLSCSEHVEGVRCRQSASEASSAATTHSFSNTTVLRGVLGIAGAVCSLLCCCSCYSRTRVSAPARGD